MSYLYRVQANRTGIRVEIGIFDPARWEGEGGISFGESAEVSTREAYNYDGPYVEGKGTVAEATMGATGLQPVEVAKRRLDVYGQAVGIAEFINDALADGDSLTAIGAWLNANLAQDPARPADGPFVYKGDIGLYLVLKS